MPTVHLETLIDASREICFDLMRDVDAHLQSTAQTGERAIAGRTSGFFEAGDVVTWEARRFGVRQRMTVRVTRCDRPDLFVDEMVSGAFKSFTHAHRFIADGDRTRMIDDFDYASPLGILGKIADWLFLERYLRRLLTIRARYLKTQAEGSVPPRQTPRR